MKKNLITIFISLLIGFLLSNYLIKQYDEDFGILPVFGEQSKEVFLIQQGVYSTFESMENNTDDVNEYIYNVIDGMYYVYIAMSCEENNVEKLRTMYEKKGIKTIVKTTSMSDNEFLTELENYDLILSETDDETTMEEVTKQILNKYKGG